jgi:hypothetical protein
MRRVKLLVASGVLAAAVFSGTGPSANAHTACAYNPPDPSYGCYIGHSRFDICDAHRDGHRTRIRFKVPYKTGYFYTPWDSYGGECAREGLLNYPTEFWLCIETEACGKGRVH